MKVHLVIEKTCIEYLPKIRRRHRKGDIVACPECGTLFHAVSYELYGGSMDGNMTFWKWAEIV